MSVIYDLQFITRIKTPPDMANVHQFYAFIKYWFAFIWSLYMHIARARARVCVCVCVCVCVYNIC